MVLRKRSESSAWIKFIFFIVMFGLAMTVTFEEVEGIDLYKGQTDQESSGDAEIVQDQPLATSTETETNSPVPVPEPASLILMGVGLSAAYLQKKRSTK
ncbi:MAG: PEP-CTERM sorting domain-containing protein [candidate division Zixibacteria bacterium]